LEADCEIVNYKPINTKSQNTTCEIVNYKPINTKEKLQIGIYDAYTCPIKKRKLCP